MSAPAYFLFTPCCGSELQLYFGLSSLIPGTYLYTGAITSDTYGNQLMPNVCYTVQMISGSLGTVLPPPDFDFTLIPEGCLNLEECGCTPISSCYQLTDCTGLLDPIFTTSNSVIPFLNTGISFKINGYTNCWTASTSLEDCACTISIVITTSYTDCDACVGYTSYKLTNCANSANVIYTSTDLSLYVNQVIEQDCPGCWFVEEFFLQPPTNTIVNVTNTFNNCVACQQTYYLLSDCASVKPDIVTTTDLSAQVGLVIRLDWCPETCWQVEVTRLHTNPTIVFLKDSFTTCAECSLADVCECVVFSNIGTEAFTLEYYDCLNNLYIYFISPGEILEKKCVKNWTPNVNLNVANFGDCIDNVCPTPPSLLRRRSIRPGYDTPACTIHHYEEIVCTFAEAVYNLVLEKRYGITTCCILDKQKWELKFELISLASLKKPNVDPILFTFDCINGECIEIEGFSGQYNSLQECQQNCALPIISYNCIEIVTCVEYECIIPALVIGTLFYKDCNGVMQQQVIQLNEFPTVSYICSIPNATNEDIYIIVDSVGPPEEPIEPAEEFIFTQTSFICESTFNCEQVEGSGGTYETLEECQNNCFPEFLNCKDCINVIATVISEPVNFEVNILVPPTGQYPNGTNYYQFIINDLQYEIYNETYNQPNTAPGQWFLYSYNQVGDAAVTSITGTCPIGIFNLINKGTQIFTSFEVGLCSGESTGFVLYSVSINPDGNEGVYFTYLDCSNVIQQYNVPAEREIINVSVCSTPGRLLSEFVQNGGSSFTVTETIIPCNC
jgi:hypothetical protein